MFGRDNPLCGLPVSYSLLLCYFQYSVATKRMYNLLPHYSYVCSLPANTFILLEIILFFLQICVCMSCMCKFTIYLECGHFVVASTFLVVLTYLFLLGLMS